MFNKELLDNVIQVNTFVYRNYNVSVSKTNWMGNYGDIYSWLDRDGIANIISVPSLKHLSYHITYKSDDGYYEVSKGDISVKLYKDEQGLMYIDVGKQVVLTEHTVRTNYKGYTKKKVEKDALDRKTSELLGNTSSRYLEYLVISNNID